MRRIVAIAARCKRVGLTAYGGSSPPAPTTLMQNTTVIDVGTLSGWRIAKKTGKMVALLGSLVIQHHPRLASKLKLTTWEGDEPINPAAMVCIGELGDAWQQAPSKLIKKYDISGVTEDGWVQYSPKPGPESEIDAIQVTKEMVAEGTLPELRGCHWGVKQPDGSHIQVGAVGSWIARLKHDPTDYYFIQETVFANTYSVLG